MIFIILLSISIFVGHKYRMSERVNTSASIGQSTWETFIVLLMSSFISFAIAACIAIFSNFYIVDINTYKIDEIHTIFEGRDTKTHIHYGDEEYVNLGRCIIESGDNEIYVEKSSNDYYWYFPHNIFERKKYVAYLDISGVNIEVDNE
jgi:hypothetical protein